MRKSQRIRRTRSPIDEEQAELDAKERALLDQMIQLESLIEQGPRLVAEERRRRREELIERASSVGAYRAPASLRAREFVLNAETAEAPRPRLKSEQRAQRITFLFLLLVLGGLLFALVSAFGG